MTAVQAPSLLHRYWTGIALWLRIAIALVLGIIAGIIFGPAMGAVEWMGELFIRLIRMLVAPLVLVVIVSGMTSIGDPRRLGTIGVRTVSLYALTTLIAIIMGVTLAVLIEPGVGVTLAADTALPPVEPVSFGRHMMEIVPLNPIDAMAKTQMLSIIFVALLLGLGAILVGEQARPFMELFDSASAVLLKLVQLVMELAPFGVFALMANAVGTGGFAAFAAILKVALCVVIGCVIQVLIVHGGLVRLIAGLSPLHFFRNISEAVMVGFSTASSAATLPVAMRIADERMGISQPVVSTVLPLGATISMDGTGLYIAILSVFAAQVFGVPLGFGEYALIVALSITVSMGAAPVPGSSLFMVAGVLSAIGIGPEAAALVVAFVLPFDRPLDMTRTVPNNTSDLATATIVAHLEGELDRERFAAGGDPS